MSECIFFKYVKCYCTLHNDFKGELDKIYKTHYDLNLYEKF